MRGGENGLEIIMNTEKVEPWRAGLHNYRVGPIDLGICAGSGKKEKKKKKVDQGLKSDLDLDMYAGSAEIKVDRLEDLDRESDLDYDRYAGFGEASKQTSGIKFATWPNHTIVRFRGAEEQSERTAWRGGE